ncbi:uncharacterized protein PG998_008728 [Apiospora kogelbergensis]|uniref:uncharacterized protein n=1 Tax=Apiospora kogelbergensis TaxID=1337665 RepID=UPI0031309B23
MEEIIETEALDDLNETTTWRMVWMDVGSPAPKTLVQLTMWEAVSFWLACLMITSTVVYNGFTIGRRSPDANLRLFLVATYAFLQLLFSGYTTNLHKKTYGYVVGQACWVVLTNLFAFTNEHELNWWLHQHSIQNSNGISISNYNKERPAYDKNDHQIQYRDRGLVLRRFRMILFGEWSVAETLGSVFTKCNPKVETRRLLIPQHQRYEGLADSDLEEDLPMGDPKIRRNDGELEADVSEDPGKAYFKTIQPGGGAIEKSIKSTRETEIKNLEKALETGLEKTLVHVGVLLGILLSTGIAPYTSVEFEKSNAMQLGSYALLLAVSTGVTALFSSLISITSAQESLKLLLRLQEHTIKIPDLERPNHHFNPYDLNRHGLSETDLFNSEKNAIDISLSDILRETHGLSRWGCLVFWSRASVHSQQAAALKWNGNVLVTPPKSRWKSRTNHGAIQYQRRPPTRNINKGPSRRSSEQCFGTWILWSPQSGCRSGSDRRVE